MAGGSDTAQIYFYAREPGREVGAIKRLTDGHSLNGAPVWSNDGRQLAFCSTARNGVNYDVYLVDPGADAPPRLALALDGGAWYPLDWSPDDRLLLLKNYVSINESNLYIADVATGIKRRIVPAEEGQHVGIGAARFAKDGQGVYVVSDQNGEYKQLRYLRFTTLTPSAGEPSSAEKAEKEIVLSAQIPWNVENLDLSADGRYIAYITNEGGFSRLNLLDARNQLKLPTATLPNGLIGNINSTPPALASR